MKPMHLEMKLKWVCFNTSKFGITHEDSIVLTKIVLIGPWFQKIKSH